MSGRFDGLSYPGISAAPADISLHGGVDVFIRRIRISLEKSGRCHDLATLAIPALRYLLRNPCLLNRVRQVWRKPFNRGDILVGNRRNRDGARPDRISIEVNGACPALGHTTAVLGAGQSDHIAKGPEQGHPWIGVDGERFLVDEQFDGSHAEKGMVPCNLANRYQTVCRERMNFAEANRKALI